jgi:uncharacterized protein (TIGR02996 family)
MKTIDKALAAAHEALDDGEETAALDRVLDGWRASRSPAIANLAEAISKRLEPHLQPLAAERTKLEAFQPLWLAIAKQKRAVDLPRLLASVLHGTNRFGVEVVNALVERGKALAAWPADPRASELIVEHLLRGGYESTSKSTYPFWSVMFEMLEKHADPRMTARLAKISFAKVFRTFSDGAKRIAWFQAQLDGVVERLQSTKPAPLPAAVDARATKLAKSIAKRGALPPATIASLARDPVIAKPKPKAPAPVPKLELEAARTLLDRALRSLIGGDDADALRALLDAWRTTRATEIAELVERVSARCDGSLPRIAEANRAATQTAWLAICREQRAQDLPRLIGSITTTFGRSTDALERVRALASWPSDARTLDGVVKQLEKPPFWSSSTKPFWSALIELAVAHHDPRAAGAFEALAARYHEVLVQPWTDLSSTTTWFRRLLLGAAKQLRERVPAPLVLDAASAKVCEKIAAHLSIEDDLLAEIYANPDDDRPREVFADVLQQRGDARGEFIVLQLTGRDPERAAELVRRYAPAWLEPLTPMLNVDECTFERGFLTRAVLGDITVPMLGPVMGHPHWSTVTELDFGAMLLMQKLTAKELLRRLQTPPESDLPRTSRR